jgi:membrane protein YqaA with SNARE-associated domain
VSKSLVTLAKVRADGAANLAPTFARVTDKAMSDKTSQQPSPRPPTLVGSIISPLAVGIVAGVGQTLGEMSGYMAGYSGQGLVNRAQFYERIEGWMRRKEKMSELVIFVLALIPNPFFDAAGMAAGVLRFPIWKYLVAAGLGKVIKNILFAYGGALSLDWISRLFG